MKKNILPVLALFSHYTGLNRLCRPVYGGQGLILMFHRFVKDPSRRIDNSGMVSDVFFDRLLGHMRATGVDIIPLRDVPQAIDNGQAFICLTMDDGYRDNVEIALPILQRHNAPATIFIPSGILDRSMDAWWLQIEEIARNMNNPQQVYEAMVGEVSRNPAVLREMRKAFTHDQAELNDRYFLSEADVKAIDREPVIEIGGHTISHPLLGTLPEEEAYREIIQNKHELEALLNRPVETFAYPFGHAEACGAREYRLAEKAGYKVAVTTRDGNVFPKHREHLTALPRYNVRGQFEQLAIFNMQLNGTYRALRSRFGQAFVTE